MKKKLFALLIAGVMAMSVNAFAAETELTEEMTTESAADTSTVVLQGLDDNGITWTLALNAENAMGCVALTPEGEDAYIVTFPYLLPVIFPFWSTTATVSSEDFQINFSLVLFGVTEAFSCLSVPTFRIILSSEKVIFLIEVSLTVT